MDRPPAREVLLAAATPGGATALIAVIGPHSVHTLGYRYAITPVLVAVVFMVGVAVAFNNLSRSEERHYPVTWR